MNQCKMCLGELLVNNVKDPAGVDPADIFFSWHYECPGTGKMQTAYRIIVEKTGKKIDSIWDSGVIESKENVYIRYGGTPLEYGTRYKWKAYVRDMEGNWTYSRSDAFFDTRLEQKDWFAKWIWKRGDIEINDFTYFRKVIMVDQSVLLSRVYVSAHNHFELFINGEKTEGLVSPAPSHPIRSKLYLTYDITNLLVKGKNTICAITHFLGGDGQNYVNGKPGFILQGEIIYENATTDVFFTDPSWKCMKTVPFARHTPFQQNRRISAVERYDASQEPERWMEMDYDDILWEDAVLSGIELEKWVLKPQTIPEGAVDEIIVPRLVGVQQPRIQVFDTGRIITGWPRFRLKGIEGVKIRMRYSEDLDENGRVRHNVCNENSESYFDEYIMKGGRLESWEPRFSYKAFRFVEFTGYPCMISPDDVDIICAHTRLSYKGDFHCSQELLNDIYKACIRTQKNNITGQMVDCPHREQAQYLADSDLQMETFGYCFFNPSIPEKVLSDFRDAQEADGTFPFVFPSNFSHPDFSIKIPEWDLHYCTLLWKTYMLYGDEGVLKKYYPAAKRMAEYYLGQIDRETGLVSKSGHWHISDWPYPDVDQSGRFLAAQNCKFYNVLKTMSRIADILGYREDTDAYWDQGEKLGASIVRELYDRDVKLFIDSLGSSATSQAVNVLAFRHGLVPVSDREEVLGFIDGKGLNCSTLVSLDLLRILFENGRQETALKLLNNAEYPGWGYMVQNGYMTTWEGFGNIESHSHAWSAYPARIMLEYIIGIKALSPGFKKIEFHPYLHQTLEHAKGSVVTVRGVISAGWERQDRGLIVSLSIPPGISAIVVLPATDQDEKWLIKPEGGCVSCINKINVMNDTIVFEIESGTYSFVIGEKREYEYCR